MPEISDLTVILCGPLAQRGPLMASLQRCGARLEPNQGSRGHHHGFTDLRDDPALGSVAVRTADLGHVVEEAKRCGWSLRLHHETPSCQACRGTGHVNHGTSGLGTCLHCEGTGKSNQPAPDPLRAELDALRAEIEALKGRR